MTTNKPRHKKMKRSKTKATKKLDTKDILYSKRKNNSKHKKEKNNKQQEEKVQKAVWRPTSPQNRRTTQQAGITNNPNHNSFTNLNM
uniref:Putative ovule protein n=1 Tax=Solanum chacoense TaxID=4108 RepID=A0A0V0GQC6_SOLCH